MRKLPSTVRLLSGGILLALVAGNSAHALGWKEFAVQGATTTVPTAISDLTTIYGYYTNSDSTTDSFIRAPDGTITTFSLVQNGATAIFGANQNGDVAGAAGDDNATQAFLRMADGTSTLFSINGSSHTAAAAVTIADWVAGIYIDPTTSKQMGFVRRPDGKTVIFASPDGTALTVNGINKQNTVIGTYGTHGYFRTTDGTMTTFRITSTSLVPVAINASGAIAGYYTESGKTHGFVRSASGSVHGFDGSNDAGGTFVTGMNENGIIVGYTKDANGIPHGYALDTNTSKGVTLNAPGGVNGTELLAIEKAGKMAAVYFDKNNRPHAVRALATLTGF